VIRRPVATERREHAEAHAEHGRDHDREERQLCRRGNELPEVVRDGLARQGGLSQIALHQMLEVDRVANGQRFVEPVVLLEGSDGSRIAGRLFTEVRRDRIAGDKLREDEDDERDPNGEQDERREPAENEADEAGRRTTRAGDVLGRLGDRGRCRSQGPSIVPPRP
jgi:hypothetical protein